MNKTEAGTLEKIRGGVVKEIHDRAFKGIWIPKEVWLNEELNVIEKLFLVEIDSLDKEQGCWASNKYFSEFFGISKGRCSQIINSLKDKKMIDITYQREGNEVKKRTIKVVNKLNTLVNKLNDPIKYSKGGYLENAKENNTSINNTNNNKRDIKHKHGSYKNVLLTDKQMESLKQEFPNDWEQRIERVSEYCESTGKTYKNYLATIRAWARRDNEQSKDKPQTAEELFKGLF